MTDNACRNLAVPSSTVDLPWPVSSRFKLIFKGRRDFSTDALGFRRRTEDI